MRWILIIAALISCSDDTCVAAAARDSGTFKNLGPQISATLIQGSTFTKDSAGKLLACCVVRGQPAKLVVFDAASGERLHVLPLSEAEGAWNATTATDGSVYVGTDPNGRLFRWVPGEDKVRELGQAPGQTFIWDVIPGADGEVFCGTYPGCAVFRYHPKDGLREVSGGPLVENENYARSVAYDLAHQKVYGGVGSHARLVELDLKTGKKTEFLPPEHRDQEFVYSVRMAGERLYAVVTNSRVGLVFNTSTRKFEKPIKNMPGVLVIAKHPTDPRVFYCSDGKLWSYDPTASDAAPKELITTPEARAMTWDGDVLVMFNRYGNVTRYEPDSAKHLSLVLKVPSEPTPIQSIALGPDGKIWMGGYLSGGTASYDPQTGKSQEYKVLSQAESMTTLGSSLYFGIYPNGRFFTYDTSKPWDIKKKNPRSIGQIEGQSRPFGAIGVEELKQVFWGTVPEYGLLGGGIAVYDVPIDKLSFFKDVVPNQSVVSLAYNRGLIVGGSTIYGGLGIKPSEKSGRLFLWDPKQKKKVFEVTPDDTAAAVVALVNGPDGNVWGVANDKLLVFDVEQRKIVSLTKLFDAPRDPKQHLWRGPTLRVHPDGEVYGDLEGKLFRVDPKTKKATILRDKDASLTTIDREGRVYFRDRINLWQYTP